MTHRLFRLTLTDALLVAVLVAVPARELLFTRRTGSSAAVEVWHEGRLYGRYSLAEDRLIHLKQGFDIEVRKGSVRVAATDCRLKLCQQMGWQHLPGRTIVCVPNRVVIRIAGDDSGSGYDAETY
ncbi:MAG: NusG domain II-containing protein [candidate division WOR-3 bacterium]